MKKITFLNLLLSLCVLSSFGQTMVNDFEATVVTGVEPLFGATATVVANPSISGLNTTDNCLQIGNTGTNWFSLVRINVNPDLAISGTETKFLSVLVYRTTTDMACRFNATADDDNGSNPGVISAINAHSGADAWEQIIIPVEFPRDSGTFSLGTLFTLIFHADIKGFSNAAAGPLDNGGGSLFVDELQILDSNPLLSTDDFTLENNISIYQNVSLTNFRIETKHNINITDVSLYDILGSKVNNISKIDTHEYDMSNLSSGLYIVKIRDDRGETFSKKLIKQ